MKLTQETLGTLVRPRILTNASLFPSRLGNLKLGLTWNNPRKSDRFDRFSVFDTSIHNVFQDLKLGDTSKDLSTCYVGEITHYFIRAIGIVPTLVDKSNIEETLKRIRKRLGSRTNLRVISVGLKLYKGMVQGDQGIAPINLWEPKTTENDDVIWFFNPWELVPITEIIKYEAVERGDLILFQKARGLVVQKKVLNKPKFYCTSSWSCYSITLLNHTADGFTRFLPIRSFSVHKSKDITLLEEDNPVSDT